MQSEIVDEEFFGGEGRRVKVDGGMRPQYALACSRLLVKGRHRRCVVYWLTTGEYIRVTQNESVHGRRYIYDGTDFWKAVAAALSWATLSWANRKAR